MAEVKLSEALPSSQGARIAGKWCQLFVAERILILLSRHLLGRGGGFGVL